MTRDDVWYAIPYILSARGTERERHHDPSGTSPAAFHALLRYVYTDKLTFDDTLVVDVLRKAMKLELTRVYKHCERRCGRGLSPFFVYYSKR